MTAVTQQHPAFTANVYFEGARFDIPAMPSPSQFREWLRLGAVIEECRQRNVGVFTMAPMHAEAA